MAVKTTGIAAPCKKLLSRKTGEFAFNTVIFIPSTHTNIKKNKNIYKKCKKDVRKFISSNKYMELNRALPRKL